MGRRLVGGDVDVHVAPDHLGQHLGAVTDQADRERPPGVASFFGHVQGLVQAVGEGVEVVALEPALDPGGVGVGANDHAAVHGDGQGLGASHTPGPAGHSEGAGQRTPKAFVGDGGKGLVGALEDALSTDVDPRTGGHLAVHSQAQVLQPAELVPGGPFGDQVRVSYEHPRCPLVGAHHPDRPARLDKQGLVATQVPQRPLDGPERRPVPRRFTGAPVDDQLFGVLGHLGVKVVVQHAQGRFLLPSLARQLAAMLGPHRAVAAAGVHEQPRGRRLAFCMGISLPLVKCSTPRRC